VLSQYTKGLAHHNPVEALALHSRLDRIKWRLWHGDTDVALSRARELAMDVAALTSDYPGLQRFTKAAAGLVTYLDNNAAAISDYSDAGATRNRYPAHLRTRKSPGDMMRKLSVTRSQSVLHLVGTSRRRKPSSTASQKPL
jgi:hypothetical protein